MKKINLKLKQSNIALIGFMGVGKSAVGKELASRLNKKLAEVDAYIVKKAGKTIQQIFQDGEIIFREMEIEAIKEIAAGKNQIIACGGGVVLNKINIDRLKQDSLIVWLTASPSVIFKRIKADGDTRPLINRETRVGDIREIIKFRRPYYQRAADIEVDTSNLSINETTEEIISRIKEYARNNS